MNHNCDELFSLIGVMIFTPDLLNLQIDGVDVPASKNSANHNVGSFYLNNRFLKLSNVK